MRRLPNLAGGSSKSGGGGSGRPAAEAPDSLSSNMLARVVDLISEGPIEGFVSRDGKSLRDLIFTGVLAVYAGTTVDGRTITGTDAVANYGYNPGPFRFSDTTNVFTVPSDSGGQGYVSDFDVTVVDDGYFSNTSPANPFYKNGKGFGATARATVVNGKVTAVTITNNGSQYTKPRLVFPPSAARAIYLDDIPLLSDNGIFNFRNVTVNLVNGGQSQQVLPDFPVVQNPINVGKQLEYLVPQTTTITGDAYDSVIIGIATQGAFYAQNKSTGDINPTSVGYVVRCRAVANNHAAEFFVLYADTISGKSSATYTRSKKVNLPKFPGYDGHTWDISVERITPDTSTLSVVDKISWAFITAVAQLQLTYPNCALAGLQINAQDFRQIPKRAYDLKLLRVQVPVNYDPETRAYTGAWNGQFKLAWTDNPAWIVYDMLTNKRYGLGSYIHAGQGAPDKWALYPISQYCDELVPDGFGSLEPRFTCNCYFQTRAEAVKALNDLLTVFWGTAYYADGQIVISQDSPKEPFVHFTAANVKDGLFNYSGSSHTQRHTVALVRYNDPTDNFQPKIEPVEDIDGILKFGIREIETVSFATTSRGQAHRFGARLLYAEQNQTELVSFTSGLDAAFLRPGYVFTVADQNRAGVQHGGRISFISSDRRSVITDRPLVPDGTNFKAIFARPAGYFSATDKNDPSFTSNDQPSVGAAQLVKLDVASFSDVSGQAESHPFNQSFVNGNTVLRWLTVPGRKYQIEVWDAPNDRWQKIASLFVGSGGELEYQELTVNARFYQVLILSESDGNLVLNFSAPVPAEVTVGGVWALESNEVQLQHFICVSLKEAGPLEYEITGLEHNPSKYSFLEQNLQLETLSISNLPSGLGRLRPPTDVSVLVETIRSGISASPVYRANLSWVPPENSLVQSYNVYVQRSIGSSQLYTNTRASSVEIDIAVPDDYFFEIRSVGLNGQESEGAFPPGKITIVGSVAPPSDIINKLEIDGHGLDGYFEGRGFTLSWDIESSLVPEFGNEPASGIDTVRPAELPRTVVKVLDTLFRELYSEEVTGTSLHVSESLVRGVLGNQRSYVISVAPVFITVLPGGLLNRAIGNAAYLYVTNPAPAVPPSVGVLTFPAQLAFELSFPFSAAPDHAGWRVWVSTIPFNITDSNLTLFESSSNRVTVQSVNGLPLVLGSIYYYRFAAFDSFGSSTSTDCIPSTLRSIKLQ